VFDEGAGVLTAKQEYDPNPVINELRHRVNRWRGTKNPSGWITAAFAGERPIKAVLDSYNPIGSTAHVRSTRRGRTAGRQTLRAAT
jgi:hypothetical protein